MGVGLCQYRAAIGGFAWIASNARLHWSRSSRQRKSSRVINEVGGEERSRKVASSNINKFKKSWGSVDRWKTGARSRFDGQRSKSLDQIGGKIGNSQSFRTRTRSPVPRQKRKFDDAFKDSCIACRTHLFDQKRQRSRKIAGKKCRGSPQDRHCEGSRNKMEESVSPLQIRLLIQEMAARCLMLQWAASSIVQMLLIISGIETNPGPNLNPTNSRCCNARQHFNRVENIIVQAQRSFQSKVTPDTLAKKVIEIEETGTSSTIIESITHIT